MQALIVDDDSAIRETLSVILREEGYDPYEASDGADAIEKMLSITDSLVVILDLWMPVMDGETTVLTALTHDALWSRTSFIIMSANPQMISPRLREIVIRYKIPVLFKPFDIDTLVELIRQRAEQLDGVPVVQRARRSGSLG